MSSDNKVFCQMKHFVVIYAVKIQGFLVFFSLPFLLHLRQCEWRSTCCVSKMQENIYNMTSGLYFFNDRSEAREDASRFYSDPKLTILVCFSPAYNIGKRLGIQYFFIDVW